MPDFTVPPEGVAIYWAHDLNAWFSKRKLTRAVLVAHLRGIAPDKWSKKRLTRINHGYKNGQGRAISERARGELFQAVADSLDARSDQPMNKKEIATLEAEFNAVFAPSRYRLRAKEFILAQADFALLQALKEALPDISDYEIRRIVQGGEDRKNNFAIENHVTRIAKLLFARITDPMRGQERFIERVEDLYETVADDATCYYQAYRCAALQVEKAARRANQLKNRKT